MITQAKLLHQSERRKRGQHCYHSLPPLPSESPTGERVLEVMALLLPGTPWATSPLPACLIFPSTFDAPLETATAAGGITAAPLDALSVSLNDGNQNQENELWTRFWFRRILIHSINGSY